MPSSRAAAAAVCLGLLATALAQAPEPDPIAATTTTTTTAASPATRLCVYDKAATPAGCTAALQASSLGASFTCVTAPSAAACAAAVAEGRADLVRLGADETAAAARSRGLTPVAAEEYGLGEATAYWSVAVVRAATCDKADGRVTAADLKGARLCSTGYRKGAGWTAPIGNLLASGDLKAGRAPRGVAGDAAAVASFFGPVCAPRKTSTGPRAAGSTGALWPEGLCDGCLSPADQAALGPTKDGKPRAFCEENGAGGGSDAYSGYAGAIDCLLSAPAGEKVVMFNKADAKAADGTKLADLAAGRDLRLWCPLTSSCAPLADYRNCNLGRVRAHALLARPGWGAAAPGAAAVAALAAAGPTGLTEGADSAAPFYSKDAKSVLDCEADGGRCASDFGNWFGLTRAYSSLEGAKAKHGLPPGAVAGIVVGCLAGAAVLTFAGMGAVRRARSRRQRPDFASAKAFATGSSA